MCDRIKIQTKNKEVFPLEQNFGELYPISQKIMRYVGESIGDYNMIRSGDRIMIGLSGGKDSLLLSLALATLKRRSPVHFSLCACIVDQTGGSMDLTRIMEYMDSIGIPLSVINHDTYNIIAQREERSPCSLCAKLRRGILASHAQKIGFNVMALGHHKDDAAETVLLNLFYGGRFKCYHPHLYMSRTGIRVIRPLLYIEEKRIIMESERLNLPVVDSCCPYGDKSKRKSTKEMLAKIEESVPEIKSNIIHALRNISDEDVWKAGTLNE